MARLPAAKLKKWKKYSSKHDVVAILSNPAERREEGVQALKYLQSLLDEADRDKTIEFLRERLQQEKESSGFLSVPPLSKSVVRPGVESKKSAVAAESLPDPRRHRRSQSLPLLASPSPLQRAFKSVDRGTLAELGAFVRAFSLPVDTALAPLLPPSDEAKSAPASASATRTLTDCARDVTQCVEVCLSVCLGCVWLTVVLGCVGAQRLEQAAADLMHLSPWCIGDLRAFVRAHDGVLRGGEQERISTRVGRARSVDDVYREVRERMVATGALHAWAAPLAS